MASAVAAAARAHTTSSPQNQALSSLLFLYKEVLRIDLDWLGSVGYAKRPSRLPVGLTREEVRTILAHLDGPEWISSMLMYGSGLRSMECVRLRIKDIDFGYR